MANIFNGFNVDQAWGLAMAVLADQAKEGFEADSRDGEIVGEICNAIFVVEDPTRNIVSNPLRKMPMRYAVGELIWYLSGSNLTRDISQFAPKWDDLSDDGVHANSAYGHRIRYRFGFDQWEYVKKLLTESPLSRQAVIHIKDASDESTKDVPCTIALQFLLRNGKLDLTVFMRSNDIWMGFPYDAFSFCALQMKMAMELGVEVGTYTHHATSLHLYKRDYEKYKKNLEDITESEKGWKG